MFGGKVKVHSRSPRMLEKRGGGSGGGGGAKGGNSGDIATKSIEWTKHGLASGKAVTVNIADLDKAWKTDRVEAGGAGGIGTRYTGAQKFLSENSKVNMSEVSVRPDGQVVFVDGRHRFAALRDSGRATVKVMMTGSKHWKPNG